MAKAWKIPYLNAEQPVNIGLRKILRTRFNEMNSYEAGTLEGTDIEFLHSMRVSSRRLQAALKLFRGAFPHRKFKYEYDELRIVIRALGEVRELDVFIEKLEKYKTKLDAKHIKAVDLLIAKQKNKRIQKRKSLVQTISRMNRGGYKEKFELFTETAL